jgi:hypothetical protein
MHMESAENQPTSGPVASAELERVAMPMREAVRQYAGMVRQALGEKLRGLTVFGSVLDASFDRAIESVESVVVLEPVSPGTLRRLADQGGHLGKLGVAAPAVMTPRYIKASLDTFPLEFIEIQQRHATVLGEDHFAGLSFEPAAVRLQCERELKRVLAGLAQGVLVSVGSRRAVPLLEREAGAILLRTLRGLLWLEGERDHAAAVDVIAKIEKRFDRKLDGLRPAVDPAAKPGWDDFDALFQSVEALGEIANAW